MRDYESKLEKIRKPINGNLNVEEFGRKVGGLGGKVGGAIHYRLSGFINFLIPDFSN
jgi:hypothetical protein